MPVHPTSDRVTPSLLGPVAMVVAVVAATTAVVGWRVALRMQSLTGTPDYAIGQEIGAAVSFSLAGGFLLRYRKARWVASTLLASGVAASAVLVLEAVDHADLSPFQRTAVEAADGVASCVGVLLALAVLPQVFPDGPLPGRRWRRVLVIAVVLTALEGPLLVVGEQLALRGRGPTWLTEVPWTVFVSTAALGVVVGAWSVITRWRTASDADRLLLRLYTAINLGLVPLVLLIALSDSPHTEQLLELITVIGPLVVVAVIAVTVLRHQLFDIRLVLRRAAVYAILAACVLLVFVAVSAVIVVLAAELVDRPELRWVGLAAATVVVVLLEPVRRRLQTRLEVRLLGSRRDPLAALAALRDDVPVPDYHFFARVTETVARAVRSPAVALLLHRGGTLVDVGHAGAEVDAYAVLPLLHRGESLGELRVAPRTEGERYGSADRRLLDQLASQVGSLVYARRRDLELADVRRRLVETVAQERARLGRDLHDGLAPTLAGAGLVAEALRRDAQPGSPGEQDAARLADRLRTAASDLRRIAHELQPADLDLGLPGAVRAHLTGRPAGVATFTWEVDVAVLPASVEQAAYLIVLEAVRNVDRHARAAHGVVSVRSEPGGTRVTITDDGIGMPIPYVSGLGIGSMRRRVEGIGGSFVVERRSAGGTVVSAWLPAAVEPPLSPTRAS